MKIIVIPDSFKGTLSSLEVCETIRAALPDHEVKIIPVADGGEGTLEAFSHAKAAGPFSAASLISAPSVDAAGKATNAPYLMAGKTAVIEMAKVAGYRADAAAVQARPLTEPVADIQPVAVRHQTGGSFVMRASTYGVGLLIGDAISRGARKIIVGLGGSSTNDGGCGMAAALGTRFVDSTGQSFVPAGGSLLAIAHIDNRKTTELIAGGASIFSPQIDIVGMCDVTNPLCGPKGAAHVFAPQKGASPEEVEILDQGLQHLVSQIGDYSLLGTVTGRSLNSVGGYSPGPDSAAKLANMPGSGAAGGMGFGIRALLGGRLERGIDMLLDFVNFDDMLADADLVITGEGSFDSQSLGGKAVSGICSRARNAGVPVVLVAGRISPEPSDLEKLGIARALETGPLDFSLEAGQIKKTAFANLQKTASQLAEFLESPGFVR